MMAMTSLALATIFAAQTTAVPPPTDQNPSPMMEHSRAHKRILMRELPGRRRSFVGPLDKPVSIFIPSSTNRTGPLRLIIHFHGQAFVPEAAVAGLGKRYVVATVNLGPGSGLYDWAFSDPAVYDSLLMGIAREISAALGRAVKFDQVTLAGFSAGHGAIRAILRDAQHFNDVEAVLLLDGLHTDYAPEGIVLEKGGTLDATKLEVFIRFAQAAIRGEKRFLMTHSEIFPGTFASVTETTDYIIEALGLRRIPVLCWGPGGMQQLNKVRKGRFEILGFAGNSGPDHIDQFHGMPEFLRTLERR